MQKDKNLWVLVLVCVINSLGFGIIVPVMYTYGKTFGLDQVTGLGGDFVELVLKVRHDDYSLDGMGLIGSGDFGGRDYDGGRSWVRG